MLNRSGCDFTPFQWRDYQRPHILCTGLQDMQRICLPTSWKWLWLCSRCRRYSPKRGTAPETRRQARKSSQKVTRRVIGDFNRKKTPNKYIGKRGKLEKTQPVIKLRSKATAAK